MIGRHKLPLYITLTTPQHDFGGFWVWNEHKRVRLTFSFSSSAHFCRVSLLFGVFPADFELPGTRSDAFLDVPYYCWHIPGMLGGANYMIYNLFWFNTSAAEARTTSCSSYFKCRRVYCQRPLLYSSVRACRGSPCSREQEDAASNGARSEHVARTRTPRTHGAARVIGNGVKMRHRAVGATSSGSWLRAAFSAVAAHTCHKGLSPWCARAWEKLTHDRLWWVDPPPPDWGLHDPKRNTWHLLHWSIYPC